MTNIERPLNSTPRVFDDGREYFEKAHKKGNDLIVASLKLDAQISDLQSRFYGFNNGKFYVNNPEGEDPEAITSIFNQAMRALKTANQSGSGKWGEYFRLAMQANMIDERVQAEISFMRYDKFDERRNLVNGAAGKNVELIEMILMYVDQVYNDDYVQALNSRSETNRNFRNSFAEQRNELRGALSEAVIMALANYSQAPSKLALPAKTYGDIANKTDITYYYTHDKEKQSYLVPIQVKTRRTELHTPTSDSIREISPEEGFTLFMSDYDQSITNYYGKTNDFTLARILVAEQQPRQLTASEQNYLDQARAKFDADIKAHKAEKPGIPLTMLVSE